METKDVIGNDGLGFLFVFFYELCPVLFGFGADDDWGSGFGAGVEREATQR